MFQLAFKPTLIFSIIIFVIHFLLNYVSSSLLYSDVILIHIIMFFLTVGGYLLLLMMQKLDPIKIGFTFLAISTIKLLVSASIILFLYKGLGKPKAIGVHYAGAYFLYIAFLSYQVFSIINQKPTNNK